MEEQKHKEIPSYPSLYKRSYFSEKNKLITQAKNWGQVKSGSTVVWLCKNTEVH